jgi:ligand-binding sensor protein
MANLWKKVLNEDIFDIEVLKDALVTYYFSTGIDVFAIDDKGNTIATCGEKTKFCDFFKECNGKNDLCKKSHLYASKQSELIGEGYIFFCPAGLVHYTAPIIKNKVYKGAFVAGPVIMDYPDEIFVDDLFINNKIDLNLKGKVLSYLREIPVVGTTRVRYLSKMLFTMANSLMAEEKSDIREKNEKMHQQARIGESIQSIKENTEIKSVYPYEKEKELLLKVKNGDDLGARATLNELLGYVFFTGGGSIEVIKARALELYAIVKSSC